MQWHLGDVLGKTGSQVAASSVACESERCLKQWIHTTVNAVAQEMF